MNLRLLVFALLFLLSTPLANGNNIWVDWSTGATQPFSNSTAGVGTVSYHTQSFPSAVPSSMSSPDVTFPFTNPINFLAFFGTPNTASIEFTFSGVSPDTQSLFTLGNLRPGNRFIISAFDASNNPISLLNWTNYGDYRLFATDTAPNLWNPVTGVLTGAGVNQNNSKNIFFGLTSNTAQIVVNFDGVDGCNCEYLDFGIAGGPGISHTVPDSTSSLGLLSLGLAGLGFCRRRWL